MLDFPSRHTASPAAGRDGSFYVGAAAAALLIVAWFAAVEAEDAAPPSESVKSAVSGSPGADDQPAPHIESKALRPWLSDTKRGISEAMRFKRPILVRLGAAWCGPCHALAAELEKPESQQALERWTVVSIDIDKSPHEARAHRVGSIPALRVLTPSGRQVAASEGMLSAADLIAWLDANFDVDNPESLADLQSDQAPQEGEIPALLRHFQNRDPAIREAAVHRLLPHRQMAAALTVRALSEGNLQTRLTALELLKEWKAPVAHLDPWQPDTLAAARLKDLETWAVKAVASGDTPNRLTPERKAAAQEQIADMLKTADDAQVRAIRERLAIYGRGLLPEVYAQLKDAATDLNRERLTALRYRLVASRGLALRWPSGVERLAATQAETRREAFDELAKEATAADEPLLLELFSDPDPLFREISLRILQNVSGVSASSGIIGLLDDPAPNVRAAVLNELAEHPSPRVVPRIVEYIAREKDPDLVVHAVRVLRAVKGKPAIDCLLTLFKHQSWNVRAEAAEAVGKCINRRSSGNLEIAAEVYTELIELLKDEDGFVVSHAVHGLESADLLLAVEPLVKMIKAHPELARDAIGVLTQGQNTRMKSVPHLQKFFKDPDARIRAASIDGLYAALGRDAGSDLNTGLSDHSPLVRTAAAKALFQLLTAHYLPRAASDGEADAEDVAVPAGVMQEVPAAGLLEQVFKLLLPAPAPAAAPKRKAPAKPVPAPASNPSAPAASDKEATPATEPEDPEKPTPRKETDKDLAKENNARDDLGEGNDAELAEFQAGKKQPQWLRACIDPLKPMLTAQDPRERVAAALCLTALGKTGDSLPVLLSIARSDPPLQEHVASALPWLKWSDRLQLFDDLLALRPGPEQLQKIPDPLASIRDRRAELPLWRLTAAAEMNSDASHAVLMALRQFYFGGAYSFDQSKITPRQRKRAAVEARQRVAAGPKWQRLVALALLLPVLSDEAGEAAQAILNEPEAEGDVRTYALVILLCSRSRAEGEKAAVAAMSDKLPEIRKAALIYLVQGAERLTTRSVPLHLELPQDIVMGGSESAAEGALPKPPAELTGDAVRPFLKDADPEVAACAGYLLALMDQRDGLDPLLRYWRLHGADDASWTQSVYRAIAHLDDDGLVPVLEEIFNRFGKENYQVREFYWTIRNMTGPKILKLRKRIRSEVGMDRLQ